MRFYDYYARELDVVQLEDITSSGHNVAVLQWLRDGCQNLVWGTAWEDILFITDSYDPVEDDVAQFIVREGDDLGWLGYFIGKSQHLRMLSFASLPEGMGQIDELIRGISCNRSIQRLCIDADLGHAFDRMDIFFRDNSKLTELDFGGFNISHESARSLALALGRSQHKYEHISLEMSNLSDESITEIADALVTQSQLNYLAFSNNSLGRNGCAALGNTLMGWHAPSLTYLCLNSNSIDDQGLHSMVSGLKNCHNLTWLDLGGNQISAAGMKSLSELFHSDNCSLKDLFLSGMHIGDDGIVALAGALKGNTSLTHVRFNSEEAGITEVGWKALSKLLCDTSTVNNTCLSNHILQTVGFEGRGHDSFGVAQYLAMNKHLQEDAAIYKMFQSHRDFDMKPFFQRGLKFLPLAVEWFERAGKCRFRSDERYLHMLESRKLSAAYQFVREFQVLVLRGQA